MIRWCTCRVENIFTLGKLLSLWFCFLLHSILFLISQTSFRTYKIISSYELARPLNVNLRFINPIRAPSAPPNVCDICDRKLWLSVGGAFSQLLAQSGYKRKLPWARNLISQCCWSFCGNFKCWTGRKKWPANIQDCHETFSHLRYYSYRTK